MADPPRPPIPPDPYGAFAAVDGLGGVASPLMAGFAVTLIALVLQIEAELRWPDAALVLLALAVVLLLQVVQLNAQAKGYAVTPAQAKEWYEDFGEPGRREVVFWELRHHYDCWSSLVRQARIRYNLAIMALLTGIGVMMVPQPGVRLNGLRLCAITVVLVGTALEMFELVAQRLFGATDRIAPAGRRGTAVLRRVVGLIVPLRPPVPRPPFPAPGRSGAGSRPPGRSGTANGQGSSS